MKTKTIKKVLKAKVTDWLKTIDERSVREAIKKDIIITGGAIASMLLKEEVKDFDVYFKTLETTQLVAKYYVNKFNHLNPKSHAEVETKEDTITGDPQVKIYIKSNGVIGEKDSIPQEQVEDGTPFEDVYDILERADDIPASALEGEELPKYRPIFLSSNAITLSNKVQIVIRFYGSVEEIHKNYDFVHCTNAWELTDDTGRPKLTLHNEALISLMAKELTYTGSRYPLCSIIRTRKFIARGWTINAGQYLKMCMQVSDLDLHDIKVLEDQLVGVDSAYFMMLITALERGGRLDTDYVCSVINKIF